MSRTKLTIKKNSAKAAHEKARLLKAAVDRRTGGKTVPPPKKKSHRYKPGTKALMEIRRYQGKIHGTELLIRKLPFARLVREIGLTLKDGLRWQSSALDALQEAAECVLVTELSVANLLAIHAKRVTIQQRDMQLSRYLRESYASGNGRTFFWCYGNSDDLIRDQARLPRNPIIRRS
ncbi:histone-fold-containing protein [Tothia fuscella]|uniref:Histone-fold-containing protein n=1 Tax=Tothia fuscella TaxID=1048955 RepID=A0A9P4NE66_9PEZI|nr:histone-fold-containing protein [Tothia fuscella]